MRNGRFILTAAIVIILQTILTKYCQIGPYLYINLLPATILCMPTKRPTWLVMCIAFACGLLVDGLSDGPLGLNAMALIPAAAIQKPLIRIVIDEDIVERGYSFSFHRNGYLSIALALTVEVAVFFIIYIIFDSAGQRSFGFNACRFLVSGIPSVALGLIVCGLLNPRQRN